MNFKLYYNPNHNARTMNINWYLELPSFVISFTTKVKDVKVSKLTIEHEDDFELYLGDGTIGIKDGMVLGITTVKPSDLIFEEKYTEILKELISGKEMEFIIVDDRYSLRKRLTLERYEKNKHYDLFKKEFEQFKKDVKEMLED